MKIISFRDHRFFCPSFNPIEILEKGGFASKVFKEGDDFEIPAQMRARLDMRLYYYKDRDSLYPASLRAWFKWYVKFYYGARGPEDRDYIYFWGSQIERHYAAKNRDYLLCLGWEADQDPEQTTKLILQEYGHAG